MLLLALLSTVVMVALLALGGWLTDRLLTPPTRYEAREHHRDRPRRERRPVQAVDETRARRDQRTQQRDAGNGARAA